MKPCPLCKGVCLKEGTTMNPISHDRMLNDPFMCILCGSSVAAQVVAIKTRTRQDVHEPAPPLT